MLLVCSTKTSNRQVIKSNSRIDSIRTPRQTWDEYALIMNARLIRGTSRQEAKQV